ncbi:MAG TPA: DMT family transporter [bacterium]|nr:DMT family transporter [bacterium]
MTPAALGLVLGAAFIHATWNLLAKRVGGGPAFVWLFGSVSSLLYAPLAAAVIFIVRPHIGAVQLLFIVGTAVLHLVYFLMLQGGYRLGDLSLVYPLARGTGPMLSSAAAIVFFGERPTPIAIAGTVLVGAGIFLLAGNPAALRGAGARRAVGFAVLTGATIAAYTLWDKRAVSVLGIPPLLLDWGSNLGRTLLVAPVAFARFDAVRAVWRAHRREVILVALLTPMAYILVLTALVFTPVSYVAPAREISILVGTAMGARLLAEGDVRRRMFAAGAMVLGVTALAVG